MKKLSEAVYRSPKWLQRFADFEFRTGEDIKGEPSEKQKLKQETERRKKIEEEEKRKREKSLRDWDLRWRNCDEREFKKFFKEVYPSEYKFDYDGYLFSSDLEKIKNKYRGDFSMWEKFDKWKKDSTDKERREREAEQKKKSEQQRIENELNDLFNRVVRDFQNNPWSDKFDTPTVGGKTTFKYRFENGWTFEMKDNEISYTDDKYRHGYTVGLIWRKKFVQLANEIIAKGKRRPASSSGNSGQGYQKKSEPFRETPKTGNPQRDKYNTLNDKIKLREDQLRKMKPNDPDRTALENELNAYKRVRDKMKKEYKFENLKTFELFGFGKKKSKSWQEKFDDIYNFYLKNKNTKNISVLEIPTADLEENRFSISQTLDNHIVFYGQTGFRHNWEVVDFSEADIYDQKSTKGVYKITPQEYEKYRIKAQEISDWLDERSEKETGKSDSSISDTGELKLDINEGEFALSELSEKVKSALQLPKSLEFEISYHLWTSNSTNELVVDRVEFVIDDLKFDHGGGRFWCEVFTKDPFGKDAYMWIESDSSHEYFDFEKHKWPYSNHKNELIKMDLVKKEMTRKEERESYRNRKFPYVISYEVTPSKWESMEFIKEITSLLNEMNLGLNKNI